MLTRRAAIALIGGAGCADWPQFRGPNAEGVADDPNLPVEFGPDKNVVWKTPVPPGNSSPAVSGPRIYLTAFEDEKLFTFGIDRSTGRVLWRREAPRPRKQVIERPANNPVSATPVSDGRNVYSFFQDFGLIAYGPDGNEIWRMPLGPFNNPFGHGASPILSGNMLIMVCDQDAGSFLIAVDKASGKRIWRTERPLAQRGYATPILHRGEVIVAGSYRLSGYDVRTGKELWYIRRLPWQIKPTPVVAGDIVYFTTWAGESEPGEQENVPSFAEALAKLDGDKNGKLSKNEIVDAKAKARFEEYLDLDDSGFLEERDWEQFRERRLGENALRAYKLGGRGDITESHFLWKQGKSLPNVPSPLFYRAVLYTLKEGGIFTSYDPGTGAVLKQARLTGALGDYYASPIAAGGHIYTVSEPGVLAVIRAGGQWEVVGTNDMREACKATPAIADGRIYVRTHGTLYCFAKPA